MRATRGSGQVHVLVVGGGIGGLATALALGREGPRVTLVERDDVAPAADVEAAFTADRRGAPQTRHTHGFLARLVRELRQRFPDVHEALLAAGSVPLPLTRGFADERPGDDELTVLAMRRSTVEWVLRRAAAAEPSVEIRTGVGVAGLRLEHDPSTPAAPGTSVVGGTPTVSGCSRARRDIRKPVNSARVSTAPG